MSKFICGLLIGITIMMIIFDIIGYANADISKNEDMNLIHWQMSQNGYNYCPYCGNEIKENKE